jgi:phosphate transport system substrate-binding protein
MRQQTAMTFNFIRFGAFAIAIFFAGKAAAAVEVKIGGTGNALGTMREVAKAYSKRNPGAKITVLPSLGSGGGIKAAADGAIDIAVSSRPLKDDETKVGPRGKRIRPNAVRVRGVDPARR